MAETGERKEEVGAEQQPPDQEGKIFSPLEESYRAIREGEGDGFELVHKVGQELGYTRGAIEAELGQSSFRENLQSLTRGAEKIWRRAKRLGAYGVMSLVLLQSVSISRPWETRGGGAQSFGTAALAEREREQGRFISGGEIRTALLSDEAERAFIRSNLDEPGKYYELPAAGGEKHVYLTWEDYGRVQELGAVRKFEFAHTHPLAVYDQLGYDEAEFERIRRGEQGLPPTFPPSFLDLAYAEREVALPDGRKIPVRHSVLGTNGVWEFEIVGSNEFLDALVQMRERIQAEVKKIFDNLTPQEREILKNKKLMEIAPWEVVEELVNDPEAEHIGRRMEESVERLAEKYEGKLQLLSQFDNYTLDIAKAQKAGFLEKELQRLTAEYIAFCRQQGIEMKFTPYQK